MEGQQTGQAPVAPKPPMSDEEDVRQNKIWALLSYFHVLFLIPLLAKRDSKFAQFHAKQGLVMFIAWWFVWIPILGWLMGLLLLIAWVIAVIKVLQGQYWRIPVIGDFAEKLNI